MINYICKVVHVFKNGQEPVIECEYVNGNEKRARQWLNDRIKNSPAPQQIAYLKANNVEIQYFNSDVDRKTKEVQRYRKRKRKR